MEAGAIYQLSGPALPWLWPALAIAGLAIAGAAIALRRRWLLPAGVAFILIGGGVERDLTLIAGAILAATGLWFCIRP